MARSRSDACGGRCLSRVDTRYVDITGAQTIADKMERLHQEHGGMFAPPQLLLDHAKAGKKFHP